MITINKLESGQPGGDYFGHLVLRARTEAARASAKFPQPTYVTLKIAEESGEVVRAAVHYAEGRMGWPEVEGEIVQLLAMLIRFVVEGDGVIGVTPPVELGRLAREWEEAAILSPISAASRPAANPYCPLPAGSGGGGFAVGVSSEISARSKQFCHCA